MNNIQLNKLNAYESIDKTLDKHEALWSTLPAMNESVVQYRAILAQIRDTSVQREVATTGLTQTKLTKKQRMADLALELGSAAFAYASKQKDQTLKAVFDYSMTDLRYISDNASIDRSQVIHQEVGKILVALADYGITAVELDSLQTAITDFKNAIGEKGSTKGTGVVNTQRLVDLFRQADRLLREELDKVMLRFRKSNAEFYDAYIVSSTVADLGGGKTKKIDTAPPKAA